MKHISNVVDMNNLRSQSLSAGVMQSIQKPLGEVDNQTAQVVERIFIQLQAIFPAWKQAWPDDTALAAARRSWTRGLMDAGINTVEQVRFGVEQCRRSGKEFAPSIGQFIQWCQPTPEMLGIPNVDTAYHEACRNAHPAAEQKWSHPAVYHAACQAGLYELAHLPERESRYVFERAYLVTVRAIMAGKELPEIPKALPKKPPVINPEVGRAAIAELRAALKRKGAASA